jgi:uncharacterized protein YrrD
VVYFLLQKYSELLNLPVFYASNGEKCGVIKDLLLTSDNSEIKGILVSGSDIDKKAKVVLVEDIISLENAALIIDGPEDVKNLTQKIKDSIAEKLLKTKVYSNIGDYLGRVKDLLVDFSTLRIEGFILSDGLVQDAIYGKNILPVLGKVEFAEDFMLVEKEAAEEMAKSGGGIKKRIFGKN